MAIKAPPATYAALAKAVKAAEGDSWAYCKGMFKVAKGNTPDTRASRVIDKVVKVKALGSSFADDSEFAAAKAQAIAAIWAAYGSMLDSGKGEYVIDSEISPAQWEEAAGEVFNHSDG
jgi:hypothetical protein